ncbi:MAG TPA: discoidin domain-containing protein, partial [Albitalea sp.]|nr:discoidin domain-containing protein [Albitalea sp.]
MLDGFEEASRWTAVHSDQVAASLRSTEGVQGKALCLDFDFNGVSGYAVARRALPLDFPANYRFEFKIKGDAPANAFQLKLVDASGENVWWMNRPDYVPPHEWQTMRVKKRHIDFAWGPATDHVLRHTEALELVVASGKGGGRGTLCFDELRLEELPAQTAAPSAPTWRREPQALLIDLGQTREFGGVVLHWREGAQASRYTVQASDDAKEWTTLREVTQGQRRVQPLWLPETEARYLRLNGATHQLAEIEIKDLAWGATANAFIEAQAKGAPRGHYPRGFSGEQSYWTLVGVDGGGAHSALMSEDGAVEIDKAGFSIEPFLVTPRGLLSWADARITHGLQEGYLPIPSVQWDARDVRLRVTSFASGSVERSQLLTRYTVTNLSAKPQTLTLALAVRPLQVNPPTQFLNTSGGVHTIHDLAWDGRVLAVDGRPRVVPLQRPDAVVASAFDAGSLIEQIAAGTAKPATQLHDESGFASGAMLYTLRLPPRGTRSVEVAAALTGAPGMPAQQATVAAAWRAKLNRVGLRVPAAGRLMVNSVRSALAHILMSRDGPALQPGTRSYARSWIRDGAMMTEGLLRLGASPPAADFVRWFAPHQFADGKVPCCVDSRGADPVPENDSHGQLIFAIAELYRYTHDRAQLAA